MRRIVFAGLLTSVAVNAWSFESATPTPPPVEHFARLPELTSPALSPDGLRLSGLLRRNGEQVLATFPIDAKLMQSEKGGAIGLDKAEFNWVHWLTNERLLVSAKFPDFRYGVETMESRLLGVNRDGSKSKAFNLTRELGHVPQIQDRIVYHGPNSGENVLVAVDAEIQGQIGVYELNAVSGKLNRKERARGDVRAWFMNDKGEAVAGAGTDFERRLAITIARPQTSAPFKTMFEFKLDKTGEGRDLAIAGVDCDKEGGLYVWKESDKGTDALFAFDAKTATVGEQVAMHPRFDLAGVINDGINDCVVGVTYIDHIYKQVFFKDPQASVYASARKLLPGRNVWIRGHDATSNKWLIGSSASDTPTVWGIIDIQAQAYRQITETYPELALTKMPKSKAVTIPMRDGKTISAYLTMPWNGQANGAPAIVMPHGGPSSRDLLDFDWPAQFLASRGYVVLQPNFRGSEGFGEAMDVDFWETFGGTSQDDIEDASRWLISEKIADPKRMCMFGWSYGGYAALMAPLKAPELYKCAASMAGVTDPISLANDQRDYIGGGMAAKAIKGDRDRSEMKAVSPYHNAEKYTLPILLMQPEKDRQVEVSQGRRMASALKSEGKTYKYIEFKNDGHSLGLEANRILMLKELEAFLAEHLRKGS